MCVGSGSLLLCREVMSKLNNHFGAYLYAVDMDFSGLRPRQLASVLGYAKSGGRRYLEDLGLSTSVLMHEEYGGITSAQHLVGYRNVEPRVLMPRSPLHRTLAHIIDPAAHTRAVEACKPTPLDKSAGPRQPIQEGSHLICEGLLDVTTAAPKVLCRSVFMKSGWVTRSLIPHYEHSMSRCTYTTA